MQNFADAMTKVIETLDQQGGSFVITRQMDGGWTAGLEFGNEDDDSPMVAGAAYGTGESVLEAVSGVSKDLL